MQSDTNLIKSLTKKRGQIKAELTRFETFLGTCIPETSAFNQLESRLEVVKRVLNEFKEVQSKLEDAKEESGSALDEDQSQLEIIEFENKYYFTISKAQEMLKQSQISAIPPLNQTLTGSSPSLTTEPVLSPKVKLPQLKLPEFSGSYSEWPRFCDTFTSLVDNNLSISNIEKFYYLQASLKGEAAQVINALPISDINYNIAWELLKGRYENHKAIVNSHLKELFELPTLTKESPLLLRRFYDSFLKNYRALENLKEPVNSWNSILIYLLIAKLDLNSKREWENFGKDIKSPTIDEFLKYLNQRCNILEALENKSGNIYSKRTNESKSFHITSIACPFCSGQHFIYNCQKFKILPVNSRQDEIKRLKLCTNCLRPGHKSADCKSQHCKFCSKKHNSLLHQSLNSPNSLNKSSRNQETNADDNKFKEVTPGSETSRFLQTDTNTTASALNKETLSKQTNCTILTHYAQDLNKNIVFLSTAIINVEDKQRRQVPCRVLLDSGSQSNFVTRELLNNLNINTRQIDLPVVGISQTRMNVKHQADIEILSNHSTFKTKLSFLVINKITDLTPQVKINRSKLNIPNHVTLADPNFNVPSKIDMLIGAEIFYNLIGKAQIDLGKGLPQLQETVLGWIVTGKIEQMYKKGYTKNCLLINSELNQQLERFWSIEEINNNKTMSKEENECEVHFKENVRRTNEGRFVVKLPLKENYKNLGVSKQVSINRFLSVERRLAKDLALNKDYALFMQEYEQLGHMSEINSDKNSKTPVYYIPHHSVVKPDSTTTKVRVVFDASTKSSNNISLNDVLKVGPVIQNDLFSSLIRFRMHNVVLIGDLAKMYRQILISPDQRDLQRIVWRDHPKDELKHFQLNTVTYGTASASFLATRCLKQIALDISETYPIESKIIENDFYMDDLLTGANNSAELDEIRKNLVKIFAEYGFDLRKFQSNGQLLLNNAEIQSDSHYIISNDDNIKTLGVSWVPSLDCFEYKGQNLRTAADIVSKRSILSFIAKIFDPLGILGPIVIKAKLIIQKLWQHQLGWDDPLPENLKNSWLKLSNQISSLVKLQIPRHVLTKTPVTIEIHGFADASERAYGCAIYIRSVDSNGSIICNLLCAKSRVAPLKVVSIPRLELCGSLLLTRLTSKCLSILNVKVEKIYLWTDSTIVLSWLACEPGTWKTFVANRVSEIHTLVPKANWMHISSDQNPADILSRGSSSSDLVKSLLWWHGPPFLQQNVDQWPADMATYNSNSVGNLPEFKVQKLSMVTRHDFSIVESYSNFNTLVRVIAYCYRFIHNAKYKDDRKQDKLSSDEIKRSIRQLIKLSQIQAFPKEMSNLLSNKNIEPSSSLKPLSPFIDDNGLIRVGGRLTNSNIEFESKHPIVLPQNHALTRLIVKHEHVRALHAGVQNTLSHIRQKYWPIRGKNTIKSVIRNCWICFKLNSPRLQTKMGNLPTARVKASRPFLTCGVDYAGPFDLKEGKLRNRKLIKGYVCVFICLATKAIHLELVSDLTSEGFLQLLKRFVSRRGLCSDIYSDNATNFVGCNNDLKNIKTVIQTDKMQTYLIHNSINWHFIPPRAPHFGGLWESAVKSVKHHLKRILINVHFTYEEFYSLLIQIEAVLNSRPIVPLSEDPNDLEALTPAHFLIGEQLTAVPEAGLLHLKLNQLNRYQLIQLMKQHFWSRWVKEYLHNLQQRNKWHFPNEIKLEVGSLVLLKEDNVMPLCWPMGRITEVHPGSDHIVRVVSIKTKSGIVKRSINKIVLLPVSDD